MIVRGNFSDFFQETMLPALHAIIRNKYRQYPLHYTKIFRMETSTRSIEQTSQVSGVGLFQEIPEGTEIHLDQPVQGFDKTFKHARFGLGVEFSRDTVEDDKIGLIARQTAELARSARETQEIQGASDFNNGFSASFPGPDGKALFATDHPLYKAGGAQSNRAAVSADLDVTSLQLGLTDFETMRDAAGKLIHVPCQKVVVHPANRWLAHELLKSALRPDTANNATNAFQFATDGLPDPFVWRYLTDPDAWFLTAAPEDTELIWFWRRKTYTDSDYEKRTEAACVLTRYRMSHGWSDFYGVWGNPGA